jgi:hypothetical protein
MYEQASQHGSEGQNALASQEISLGMEMVLKAVKLAESK